ncbi:thioredoxin family protein [Vampirovibrio sp.]|uniref:thioredoxin family protein n=1 Tax=Vampirovibrio sp. TaxID=2717857 RepID=UPI003592F5B2
MKKKCLIALLVLSVVGISVSKGLLAGWAASRPGMVVFTANWCASCREVVPLVRDIASQNNISVSEIDVDSAAAPKQAQGLGLAMPQEEPPQVFFVNKGRSVLIYNGKNYRFGYQDAAKTTILQNLQRAL